MMRISTLLLLLPFAVVMACATGKDGSKSGEKEYTVSGKVIYVKPYCGGAAPSEEMEKKRNEGEPYANKQMYVRRGGENDNKEPVWQKFTTDANGNYSFVLEKGEYCIIEERKHDYNAIVEGLRSANYKFDTKCLNQWFSQCDFAIKIRNSDLTGQNITITGLCDWQGPVPCVETGEAPR